jgi:serine/threonine protein kinase
VADKGVTPLTTVADHLPAPPLVWDRVRGLVHGEVKPSNILIDGRGNTHLADFGLTPRISSELSPDGEASPRSRLGLSAAIIS